jgi:5-methylcytosine-specific restriction protein A
MTFTEQYLVVLKAEGPGPPAILRLRRWLKHALRCHRLERAAGRIEDMPIRPKTHRGPTARQARQHDRRGSAAARGYDHRWRKCRSAYLRDHPLCADCQAAGVTTAAVEAHHVRKIRECAEARLDWGNLIPLCKSCHSKRTARGE